MLVTLLIDYGQQILRQTVADHIHHSERMTDAAELLARDSASRLSPSWCVENLLKPAVNAGPLSVYNTVADLASLPTLHLEADEAKPYSPEWFARGFAGGVGAAVPFAIMGAATGKLMEAADSRLAGTALGARLSPYLTSEKIATVAGASMYAALQRPDADHTRFGNAAGTAIGMSVFITGAGLVENMPISKKALAFPIIGFVGGATMVEASQLSSNFKLAKTDQVLQGAVLGTTMNSVMGLSANYMVKSVEQFQERHSAISADKIVVPLDTDGCSTRISMDHHHHDHEEEEKTLPLSRKSIRDGLERGFSSRR